MYKCDDESVSGNSETMSLDVADGEIKEFDCATRSQKCGKAAELF